MCKSNVKQPVPVASDIQTYGPLRGLQHAFDYIDNTTRDAIVDYVCPDKYRAWNFIPSKEGGFGSIEFRRAPGVVDAKKSKHWIAFTMAFANMAIQFNPAGIPHNFRSGPIPLQLNSLNFESRLLACASQLGVHVQLDPGLRQSDNPRSLYISSMAADCLLWLQRFDLDFGEP